MNSMYVISALFLDISISSSPLEAYDIIDTSHSVA